MFRSLGFESSIDAFMRPMVHSNATIGIMRFTLLDAVVGANPIAGEGTSRLVFAGGAEFGSG